MRSRLARSWPFGSFQRGAGAPAWAKNAAFAAIMRKMRVAERILNSIIAKRSLLTAQSLQANFCSLMGPNSAQSAANICSAGASLIDDALQKLAAPLSARICSASEAVGGSPAIFAEEGKAS